MSEAALVSSKKHHIYNPSSSLLSLFESFSDFGSSHWIGGFCIQLSHIYPELSFVVQDRAPVLQQAQNTVWPMENQSALDEGRVKFIPHSFFEGNPVKGADVYWLRYILYIQPFLQIGQLLTTDEKLI